MSILGRGARAATMLALISGTLVAGGSRASAGTPPADGLGAIDVIIRSPPVLGVDLDFRLLLDGSDVRPDRCRLGEISYITDAQVFRCEGLADGAYTIELGPLPDGWYRSAWECAEPIGYSLFAPQPTIGSGSGALDYWGCVVSAGPPSIAAEFQPIGVVPEVGPGFGYGFVGTTGTEVPALCAPSVDFSGPTICHVVDPGTYTMRIDGVPDGYRTRTACEPSWRPSGEYVEPTPDAVVTTDEPAWTCNGWAWAPIAIESIDGATLTLSTPEGVVDGACRAVDDGTTWHCLGIPDGAYHLDATLAGAAVRVTCVVVDETTPEAPQYIDDPTGDVTVAGTEPEQCSVSNSPPGVAATTTTPVVVGRLAETGGVEPASAATAGLILLIGCGCLAIGSRRRRAVRAS
jgi:hypothetical protein